MTLAASGDGTHLARLRIDCGQGRQLTLTVLMEGGRLDVRMDAADAAAAAWAMGRVERIREAVKGTGADLGRLEVCRDGRGGGGARDGRGKGSGRSRK